MLSLVLAAITAASLSQASDLQSLPGCCPKPKKSDKTEASETVKMDGLADARQAFDDQNYEQAAQLYRQHIAAAAKPDYEAMYGLARSLAFGGHYKEALEAYNQVLKAFPKDPDALVGRGRVHAWLKQDGDAEADFAAVIKDHPDSLDAWQAQADLYYWRNADKKAQAAAEDFLTRWRKAFPKRPEPLLGKARYLMAQRHFPEARQAIGDARKLGADSASADRLLTQVNRQRGGLEWEALAAYEFEAFQHTQPPWHTGTLGLGHYFDWGFISLQGTATQRFGLFDQAIGADGYFDLWPGASGNARVMFDWNPQVLPRVDLFTQLYQSIGDIFELSGGYRLMAFPAANVHFFDIGLAAYLGNWYVGAQPMLYLAGEGPGAQLSAWGRYLFDNADDYVELRTAFGRRIATVAGSATGPSLAGQTTFNAAVNGQYFVTPNIGLLGTVDYNYDDQFPARFGFTVGTKVRW